MNTKDYEELMGQIERTLKERAPIPTWKVLGPDDFTTINDFLRATDYMKTLFIDCSIELVIGEEQKMLINRRAYLVENVKPLGLPFFVELGVFPDMSYAMAKILFGKKGVE